MSHNYPGSKVDSDVRGTEVAPNSRPKFDSGVDEQSGVNRNQQPRMTYEEDNGRTKKVEGDKKKKKGCFGCF